MIQKIKEKIKHIFSALGPGVITGAADDDPSGIGTYSVAGASVGLNLLWTALLTWPMMAAVQMMCARIGMVSGRGMAGCLRKKIPRPVLIIFSVALLFANTLNVGADLSAMADAGEMLTGISSHILVIVFGVGISWATVKLRYRQIASVLKWLALFLFSYIAVAFTIGPNWNEIFHFAFIPRIPTTKNEWGILVAILGTTISPYLFYWQAAEEIEEEKTRGHSTIGRRKGATSAEILDRKLDVGVGTFFSNIVMFFIILTTALTLHRAGITEIETSRQAAEALKPLAGHFAAALYTIGLLGVGFLAIPTLTGSAAYSLAETFGWRQGLDEKFGKARAFYSVIVISTLIAIALDFFNFNPVKALYWSAVVNGILAPFLLIGILLVASDPIIMAGQPSSFINRVTVLVVAAFMFLCAIAMFIF